VLVWVGRVIGLAIALWVIDRLLLGMESRGWIFYRRTKGWRGRAMYHAQELDGIFNPGMNHVQEAYVTEEEEEDRSGDPPVPGHEGSPT